MKTKLFVAMVVLGAASFGAGCDDTENTGGAGGTTSSSTSTKASTTGSMTTTTTTGANMTSTSSGAALCPVTGTTDTCENACSALYDCAALTMCDGKDLCAGVDGTPAQKMAFIGAAMGTCSTTMATACTLNSDCPMGETCDGGCLVACANTPALKNLVDPMDCGGTVSTLSTVNPSFKAFCTGMP